MALQHSKVVGNALLWMIGRGGIVHAMHYLDDGRFLTVGPMNSTECDKPIQSNLQLCDCLHFVLSLPSVCLLSGCSSIHSFFLQKTFKRGNYRVAGLQALQEDRVAPACLPCCAGRLLWMIYLIVTARELYHWV